MNKHRLAAFTIMELTVAMLVSALVIGITYTAYSLISRYYSDYKLRNDEMAVMIKLDELLQKDFERADGIYQLSTGLRLTSTMQTISYQFTPSYVLRTAAGIDTFKVNTQDIQFYFEHRPLSGDAIDTQEPYRADELEFTVLYRTGKFPYHYLKQYSSENLINQKAHALN